jgi:alkanesulfonate monooxygenase SsuD/methylene tetrahydromethanopterin reductase-like flavin-dependent oxidoreductase (luciferase family)
MRRGVQRQLPREELEQAACAAEFRADDFAKDYMVTGTPSAVIERLRAMKNAAEADELVLVAPGVNRAQRIASYEAIAETWRSTGDKS